jgi:hypothetical protein
MRLAIWQRALLAGLVTMSMAGGTLTPVVAGHAAAAECDAYIRTPGGGVRPTCVNF